MGMETKVRLGYGAAPLWPAVAELLGGRGYAVQLRMIDGQLAFPDEGPPADWRELRLGTPGGMVTLRRAAGEVLVVVWGNADAGLLQAWNAVTWACAEVGAGVVETTQGALREIG